MKTITVTPAPTDIENRVLDNLKRVVDHALEMQRKAVELMTTGVDGSVIMPLMYQVESLDYTAAVSYYGLFVLKALLAREKQIEDGEIPYVFKMIESELADFSQRLLTNEENGKIGSGFGRACSDARREAMSRYVRRLQEDLMYLSTGERV